jgi:hypothetical protein
VPTSSVRPPGRASLTTGPRHFRGYSFEITADDEHLLAYVDRLYGGFPPAPEAVGEVHSIALLSDEDGSSRLLVDGSLVGSDAVAANLIGALVHTLTRRMLDATDALGLHAGGVARAGVGVALPAPMESGKTTLTAGLVRAGFSYLSDESVLLEWGTNRCVPFPKPLSLDPGSWDLFPELEPETNLPDDGYKASQWQVAPTDIRADAVAGPTPIQYFVFPRYAEGATTQLQRLARGEAVIELAKNTFRFNERARRSLDALAAAAQFAECYRLDIGRLDRAIALVSELVEDTP